MPPCPCAGRLRSALHDIERYRRERDDYQTEARIQEALAAKSEDNRRKALHRATILQAPRDCSMCSGTGTLEGNGSAMVGGRGATHAEERPSYRAQKLG